MVGRRRLAWVVLSISSFLPPAAGVSAQVAEGVEPEPSFLTPSAGPDRAGGPAPSSEARAALREMEHELDAFSTRAAAFDHTVVELGRRELRRRHREVEQDYATRIGAERALETEAREHAIALLERFVDAHPADEPATPDAMLRLGELYAERSLATPDASSPDAPPDYAATIAIYERLLERFPGYANRGAALYVLGYCLDRDGRGEEAIVAWRRALCGGAPSTDDYASCTPVGVSAALAAEMWLRLGGHDFDAPDAGANARAIAAYTRALDGASTRVRSLALYMLAWAHYRDGDYEPAIERFTQLVEDADAGRGASSLRAEAIDYVAIALADDDWNGDRARDTSEGVPSALARATDPALIAQDRPWTIEVLLALGRVAFDEGHYDDASAVLEETVRRFPLDHRVPAALVQLARARDRMGDETGARDARERLAGYTESSSWARHNEAAHPREVAEADRLAREYAALVGLGEAVRCHEHAQSLRTAGNAEAAAAYACAIEGYERYLATHADDPEAYGVSIDLADALFWSGRHEDAARAYEAVRDSAMSDASEATAARMAIEAYRAAIEDAGIAVRTDPPASGQAEVPPLVAAMARARETFLARVPEARDGEHLRGAYTVNQALLLDAYGYRVHARERLTTAFEQGGCGDDAAATYRALRGIVLRADGDERGAETIERLASAYTARHCEDDARTASASGASCDEEACASDALCTARCDLTTLGYRRGLDAYHRAESASEPERTNLYEQAAARLLSEIDRAPDHPDAPSALLVAGDALDRAGHDAAALRVYQRAIDELAPRQPGSPERRAAVDRALALAWLRLGHAAARVFDDEAAARAFGVLSTNERFASSSDPTIVDARTDAEIGLAAAQARSADYLRAAATYERLARAPSSTADEVRLASWEAAEMHFRAHDWASAATAFQAFAERWPDDPDHAVATRACLAEIARARHHHAEERAALAATLDAYRRTQGTAGTPAAALAADAALRIADDHAASFSTYSVDPGAPATMQAYVEALRSQIAGGAARARSASAGYEGIAGYGHAPSTIAALVAQGTIDERLARGTLDAPFVVPRDVARALHGASPDVRAEAEERLRGQVADTLDQAVRPVECRAIARYLLAARVAREATLDDPHVQRALERLATYGEDRIAECVAAEHERDPSFAPYVPGEITRTPRGLDAEPGPSERAPSLAE